MCIVVIKGWCTVCWLLMATNSFIKMCELVIYLVIESTSMYATDFNCRVV